MSNGNNYNFIEAVNLFNQDQIRTQTMYNIRFSSGIPKIDDTLERMQVYGNNFTLPDRTINYEDLQYRAYKIPVATNIEMGQDHSVTLYADVRGDLRRALLDWQAATINPDITAGSYFESNRRPSRIGPGDATEPQIIVDLLAPDFQTPVETTTIHGVRIVKVGGLELSNTSASVSTFQVDFKSVWWEQNARFAANNTERNRNTTLGNGGADAQGMGKTPGSATNDPIGAANLS